mgnify:CR=1 FL=1
MNEDSVTLKLNFLYQFMRNKLSIYNWVNKVENKYISNTLVSLYTIILLNYYYNISATMRTPPRFPPANKSRTLV